MSKLILLLPLLLLHAQDKPPEKCAISGTVVDAVTGHPLNKVDLTLEPSAIGATTDAKGVFIIKNLDPGQYFLAASRNGYLDTHYGARRPGGILVTCSCSHHVSESMLLDLVAQASLDAARPLRILERRTQSQDHPILLTVPETHYLKCLILEVV